MLPSWLNDIGTLVTIITGLPIILGWIISWMGQEARPPSILKPIKFQRITLWEAIKTGISQVVLQPETPVWDDAVRVILATIFLIVVLIFYLPERMLPIELQLDQPLYQLASLAVFGWGFFVTFLWTRLFLKIDYLNQKAD